MTHAETTALLAEIEITYPYAYSKVSKDSAELMVYIWQQSFATIPLPLMRAALHSHRLVSKYPPTIAELVEQLRTQYFEIMDTLDIYYRIVDEKSDTQQLIAIAALLKPYIEPNKSLRQDITALIPQCCPDQLIDCQQHLKSLT